MIRKGLEHIAKIGYVRGDETDAELARIGISLRPERVCPSCGGANWWPSSVAGWQCWNCYPPEHWCFGRC